MWTSHPAFRRMFALATVSVGLVHCVSTHSPSFEAWIVNKAILPQSMSRKGRSERVKLRPKKRLKFVGPQFKRAAGIGALRPVRENYLSMNSTSSPGLLQDSRSLFAGEALIAVAEPEILQMWPDGYKRRVMKIRAAPPRGPNSRVPP